MLTALEYATVETGLAWDAVRLPEPWGTRLCEALAADADERAQLGHVVLASRSDCSYWPVTTGTAPQNWPQGVLLLQRHAFVTLPGFGLPDSYARWLHRPQIGAIRPTGAAWLAAALDTHQDLR